MHGYVLTEETREQMTLWSKTMFVCALGEEEGVRVWRTLPAAMVIAWWLTMAYQAEC